MIRTVLLTCCVLVVLAVGFYGVILNGFGLVPAGVPVGSEKAGRQMAGTDPAAAADPSRRGPANGDGEATPGSGADAEAGEAPSPAPSQPAETAGTPARDVTPPNVLSRPTSTYIDPSRRPAVEEEAPDTRLYHRVIVADAGTLRAGDTVIRFAGVRPLGADRTCTDAAGQDWPCGRVAAAALRMLIRHRAVECAVAEEGPEGIVGTCAMGLRDINGWLVEHGWAEAAPQGGYEAAAEIARAEGRGMHRPKWQDTGRGGSGTVPAAAFTAPSIPTER